MSFVVLAGKWSLSFVFVEFVMSGCSKMDLSCGQALLFSVFLCVSFKEFVSVLECRGATSSPGLLPQCCVTGRVKDGVQR